MHPAPSIIVFTTLSGLGYGLAAVLGLGMLDPAALATRVAYVLALALIAGGLVSSTLHLGNPRRAWRAFSQWRSSWLSREGVMSILTFLPLVWSAWATVIQGRYLAVPGLLATALCLGTVYCTAMIYASLRSVQAWHTPLTPACYLLFSAAGGFTAATFLAICAGTASAALPALAIASLAGSWAAKHFWRQRMIELVALSTPETATGLGFIGKVRLLERPHMNENYLTTEMGFKVARKHAAKVWTAALWLGGIVPVLLLAGIIAAAGAGPIAAAAAGFALLSHYLGILAERWLFFAEARHAVMNYYGG